MITMTALIDPPNEFRNQRGFTLLEISLVMVIIGLLYMVWSYTVPWIEEESGYERSRSNISEAEEAIIAYARSHYRLPCPDTSTTPNGLQGSGGTSVCAEGDVVGRIPYADLLLPAPNQDAHHVPITYAVYRDADDNADLATRTELINVIDDVDIFNVVLSTYSVCDFCEALHNAETAEGNTLASVSTDLTLGGVGGCDSGNFVNQAFVLASSGMQDADADDNLFDGVNDTTATCFASPYQIRSREYDDIVSAVSFNRMIGALCRSPHCLNREIP